MTNCEICHQPIPDTSRPRRDGNGKPVCAMCIRREEESLECDCTESSRSCEICCKITWSKVGVCSDCQKRMKAAGTWIGSEWEFATAEREEDGEDDDLDDTGLTWLEATNLRANAIRDMEDS